MFFKKKEWIAGGWWEKWNEKQRVCARQLADWLGRKTAKVPLAKMRSYVVSFLIVLMVLNVLVTIELLREVPDHPIPISFGRPERLVIPPPRCPAAKVDLVPVLDSFRRDTAEGRQLDSFLRARPGLMDSVRGLEGMAH